MIKLNKLIGTNYATKQSDAEKVFNIWRKDQFKSLKLDLDGTSIIATAFFNKLFFLFKQEGWSTDKLLDNLEIFNSKPIHQFAFQSSVDISYNNEKK